MILARLFTTNVGLKMQSRKELFEYKRTYPLVQTIPSSQHIIFETILSQPGKQ